MLFTSKQSYQGKVKVKLKEKRMLGEGLPGGVTFVLINNEKEV